jgi:DNA-binding response OmpR family regulator
VARRVLLAEDEALLADMITYKLEREGFEVVLAEDGGQAAEISLSQDLCAAILDIMMPVMDGFQVLRKVKNTKPTLPVILLSARGQQRDIDYGMELGASYYLTKPFKPAELVECLNNCIGDTEHV